MLGAMSVPRADVVRAWVARAERDRVLGRELEALVAEVAGWVELLLEPRDREELTKLLALHGRAAGFEGRPASVLALRLMALEEAWAEAAPDTAPTVLPYLRTLLRVALDAHSLGAAEARELRHHRALRDMTPVFRAVGGRVVAILLGPLVPDLLDAAMARVLHTYAGGECSTIVLDLLGAERDDARFADTIAALLAEPAVRGGVVVLTGLSDPARTEALLREARAELSRVRMVPRLSDVLG